MSQRVGNPTLFDALAAPSRRYVLSLLRQRPLSRTSVATSLAAWNRGTAVEDVTADEQRRATIELHHHHLPKLVDAGLLSYDPATGWVERRDHPAFCEDWVEDLLRQHEPASVPLVRAGALADLVRRRVLAVLRDRSRSVTLAELTTALVAMENDAADDDPEYEPRWLRITLHHVHLPALADLGLVVYDAGVGTVSPADESVSTTDWLDDAAVPEPSADATVAHDDADDADDHRTSLSSR